MINKSRARGMQKGVGMWADESQRERIFEMIGTDSVTHLRVRNARVEMQRRGLIAVLVATAITWIAVSSR